MKEMEVLKILNLILEAIDLLFNQTYWKVQGGK